MAVLILKGNKGSRSQGEVITFMNSKKKITMVHRAKKQLLATNFSLKEASKMKAFLSKALKEAKES